VVCRSKATVEGVTKQMPWTREQAVEMGRKGAGKGGLARAARLSAARRLDIAMLANAVRWRNGSCELEWIDRELDKLSVVAAYALKNGDLNLCQKAIRAKLGGIRQRISTRRLLEAKEREDEQHRLAAEREAVCVVSGYRCGGELYDHGKKCVVRDCRCFGRKHYFLRRSGPLSRYVRDATENERAGRFPD
jgi:hypothetical protein